MLKKSTVALLCATVASALLSSDATEDIGGDGSSCGCGGDALSRSHYIPPQDAEMGDDAGAKRDAKAVDESSCNEGCEDEHTAAMVELEGGNFQMGSDAGFFPEDEEGSKQWRFSGSTVACLALIYSTRFTHRPIRNNHVDLEGFSPCVALRK